MKKAFILASLICILSLPIGYVYAQGPSPTTGGATEVQLLEPSVLGDSATPAPTFNAYVSTMFTQILIIAAVLAVLMIVLGGLQYILSFSGGSKEEGRKKMTFAVGGLILALAAWLILNTINGTLTNIDLKLAGIPAPVNNSPTSLVYHPAGSADPTARDRVTFNSRDECLQYVRNRVAQGDTSVSEADCRSASEESGDTTAGERDAQQICLQRGYIECVYSVENPEPAPSTAWGQTTRDACGGVPPANSGLNCWGHTSADESAYLIGTKAGQSCFDGPYDSTDACNQAITTNSLRFDTGNSPSCVDQQSFASNNTLPYCRNIADTSGGTGNGGNEWDQWRQDPGIIDRQRGDVSPSLKTLLGCMRGKITNPNVGKISSFSDDNRIGNLTPCDVSGCGGRGCQHSCRSCHYGGGTGTNKSMAVDFGDEQNKDVIKQAARDCNVPSSKIIDEGDHVHVSTADCPRN